MTQWIGRWARLLWYLLHRRRFEGELEREMVAHRAMMGEPQRFGDVARLRERSADIWGWTWVDDLKRDIHQGARRLVKSPAFTSVAALALAIGIGANLAIFGFINALLLSPLPAHEPHKLVRVDRGGPNPIENSLPYDDYLEYRDRNQSLTHVSLFHPGGILPVRIGRAPAENIHVMPVTGNYFETLGIAPSRGRLFGAADDQLGAGAVVLSHDGWTRDFQSDPDVIGQTILISGTPFVVMGVTPPIFRGTVPPVIPRIFATWQAVRPPDGEVSSGFMIGRLKRGATLDIARADFARIASQLTTERRTPVSVAVYQARTSMPGSERAFSLFGTLFMVIVGAVLWSACSNVAILQLVRSNSRRREMAIRLAVGASRAHLVRQLLTENLLLAAVAGSLGVGLALGTARWLTQLQLPVPMPIALAFDFDWRVAVFAVALSVGATLFSCLGAVLDARRTTAGAVLRQTAGSGNEAFRRRSLIVTQVALTTVLLVVAVAMMRSLIRPPDRELNADGVSMATVSLPKAQYTPERAGPFFERLLDATESSRGVIAATVVETIPLANNRRLSAVAVVSDPLEQPTEIRADTPRVLLNHVSRGHFRTLGISLLEGRDFEARDDARAPRVVIVNETLRQRMWPGASGLGERLRIDSGVATVVGIARDSKYQSISEEPNAFIYRPLGQAPYTVYDATLLVKTADPTGAVARIRSLVADLDEDLVAQNLNTLDDRLGLALLPNRAAALASGLLGTVALGLGLIGTYSVMAFLVLERRREIGIRIAVGALPRQVVGLIAAQGVRWTVAGLGIGTVVAIGALNLLRGLVGGVSLYDPLPFVAVVLLLGMTSYSACIVPARRAGSEDPVAALRD